MFCSKTVFALEDDMVFKGSFYAKLEASNFIDYGDQNLTNHVYYEFLHNGTSE